MNTESSDGQDTIRARINDEIARAHRTKERSERITAQKSVWYDGFIEGLRRARDVVESSDQEDAG